MVQQLKTEMDSQSTTMTELNKKCDGYQAVFENFKD